MNVNRWKYPVSSEIRGNYPVYKGPQFVPTLDQLVPDHTPEARKNS
jgi:hypothetical protein